MGMRVPLYITVLLHLIIGINALENLSLDNKSEMSTQRSDDSGSEGAVDGNITQTVNSNTCALTKVGKYKEAWWRVDLNGTFAITELKIYLLNKDLFRFRYYSVHVTDTLDNWKSTYCTCDHYSAKGPNVPIFTLNCDAKGRYVTILLDRSAVCTSNLVDNACAILQLCEVQVLGCQPGTYGRSCNLTCPTNCREDLCSIDQGECYQCKDGYLGNTCQNACSAGYFGSDCSHICGKCLNNEACIHTNGTCTHGCNHGFTGLYCNTSCEAGKHGPDCIYNCSVNCVDNKACDSITGSCNGGCKPGWFGDACYAENIALDKTAEISTQRSDDSGAEGAIDGDITQTANSGTCALTKVGTYKEAWWRVDLNGTFAITELKIYLLNTDLFRFRYYSIHVTDTLDNWKSTYCTRDHHFAKGPHVPIFTLNCDAKGRYVTILLDRSAVCTSHTVDNACAILQLCEVQVLGCQPGKYGHSCNLTCPANCRDNVCSIDKGTCYQCKDGYLGNKCQNKCTAGLYGQGCTMSCHGFCADGLACSHTNGKCLKGCMDGYMGEYCDQNCKTGKHGPYCIYNCSINCGDSGNCDRVTGSCDDGCKHGWTGNMCNTKCGYGTFGLNCSTKCGKCHNNATCNHDNGYCDSGCSRGFRGIYCNDSCLPGTFGRECRHNCSGNCLNNDTCDGTTGICVMGCDRGWEGPHCNISCDSGYYGEDCSDVCGRCYKGLTCDRQNGSCYNGCDPGFTGTTCQASCQWRRYGVNCSFPCPLCEQGCHHVSGECVFTADRIDTDGSITSTTPWVIIGVSGILNVVFCVFIVIMCRRNQYCVTTTARQSTNLPRREHQTEEDRTSGINYEELQVQSPDSRKNVYESLQHERVEYTNTILT